MPRIHFESGIQPALVVIPQYFVRLIEQATFAGSSGPPGTWQFHDGALDYHVRIENLVTEEIGGRAVVSGGTITAFRTNIVAQDYDVTMRGLSLDVATLRAAHATDSATPSGAVIRLLLEQDWTWIDNYSSTTLDGTLIEGTSGQLISLFGNDRVFMKEGNDRVWLGTGNDFGAGNRGNDSMHGEDGDDTLFGNQGSDTLDGGAGDDQLYGGRFRDVIGGGAGADIVNGGGGDDSLDGGEGADTIRGGAGDDTLHGGDGSDVFEFRGRWSSEDSDVILDFESGVDMIRLYEAGTVDTTVSGGSLIITWDGGTITLQGVTSIQLETDLQVIG